MNAANAFVDSVASMSNPNMLKPGIWGLKKDEVEAIRSIVMLRYIAGWHQRDVEQRRVRAIDDYEGKGKGKQT